MHLKTILAMLALAGVLLSSSPVLAKVPLPDCAVNNIEAFEECDRQFYTYFSNYLTLNEKCCYRFRYDYCIAKSVLGYCHDASFENQTIARDHYLKKVEKILDNDDSCQCYVVYITPTYQYISLALIGIGFIVFIVFIGELLSVLGFAIFGSNKKSANKQSHV